MISRRHVLSGLGTVAGLAAMRGLVANYYPALGESATAVAGQRVRWIVPNAAGGGYDSESRLIQRFLEPRIGADVVIDNVPGAGGIIGARTIAAARPDGLTIGMIGVPGLLVADLLEQPDVPNPATDFTILGRVGRSWHVWASSTRSPLRTLDDALAVAQKRPLVFAINEIGSANFVSINVSAPLVGVEVSLVAGFSGVRESTLAAIRNEVDLVCFNFETLVDLIDGGDLRPLLQVSAEPVSSHASLAGVPVLGGSGGIAARVAQATERSEADALESAQALIGLVAAGRVVVAPRGLDSTTSLYLRSALRDALADPTFKAAAGDRLDAADADVTEKEIRLASADAAKLVPVVNSAIRKIRT